MFSCSKDDDSFVEEPPNEFILEAIIGSWSFDTVTVNGTQFDYPHTENCNNDYFQFYNEEGKVFEFEEMIILNCENCADCAVSQTLLRWQLNANRLKLFFGEQLVVTYTIIEVNEDELIYNFERDYDEDGDIDLIEVYAIPYDPNNDFD